MRKATYLTALLTAAWGHVQGGTPNSSLQEALSTQFVLTKVTPDRSDIITPGTELALLKFGLKLRSVASPAPPLSTYKNGKISGPSFTVDMKDTLTKVPGKGTTADYPLRQFRTVERLWISGLSVGRDGVVLTLYSDSYDDIRYYGRLKFPFEKHSEPASDEILQTIAEVLQKVDTPELERVAGTYVGVGAPANQIQLNSDGTYSSVESGKNYTGPFLIHGSTLMLRTGNAVATGTLEGNTITDHAGSKWVKATPVGVAGSETPPQVPIMPLNLPATYVSAQNPADQLQLNADKSILLRDGGQAYHGTFTAIGNTLELNVNETNTKTTVTLQGNNLTDSIGQTWVLREQPSAPTPTGDILRNEDIIKLAKAGIDDATIIALIGSSKCQFDTSANAIVQLKRSGVSAAVLKAVAAAPK